MRSHWKLLRFIIRSLIDEKSVRRSNILSTNEDRAFLRSWMGYADRYFLQNICLRSFPSDADPMSFCVGNPAAASLAMSSFSSCEALSSSRSDFLSKNQVSCIFGAARSFARCFNAGKRICCTQAQVTTTTVAPAERIKQGFAKFKSETFLQNPKLFGDLANGQYPKFMVIACSDSRVCPTTILGFQPGEAFVVRNVANMVPPPEEAGFPGTSAALEYAVTALKVENILVIGHSKCGGIKALMTQKENAAKWSAFIEDWIKIGGPARAATLECTDAAEIDHQCTKCEKESVNVSLGNLLSFPFVKDAVASGQVALHGGYYNFVEGAFEYWTFGADGKPGSVTKFA